MSLLVVLLLLALLLAAPRPIRGDVPTVTDNGNASRTVTWNMTDRSGLAVQNATVAGGNATLPWQGASLAWNRASDFVANGTLPPGMVANSSGISLWANASNYVVGGNFSSPGTRWNYASGDGGNVSASWNSAQQVGELDHAAPSTVSPWDEMDYNVQSNWFPLPGIATITQNTTGTHQGPGMMGIHVAAAWTGYLGIVNLSSTTTALDWSHVNRLVLWIELNVTLSVGFNLTAVLASGSTVGTQNQSLTKGWQQLTVDLDELGNASQRASLKQVTLRFNAVAVPIGTWFYVDDVQYGMAKDFSGTASIYQSLSKTNTTTSAPGSAMLSFDWRVANATGAVGYLASVNLSGGSAPPSGAKLDPAGSAQWHHTLLDVSSSTSAPGSYILSLQLFVAVNTTAPTNVTMFVDNVSLLFPDRHNTTFLSNPLTMGCDSVYLQLSWNAGIPADTTVVLSMRSGNNSNPGSGAWSGWQRYATPGTYAVSIPGAIYFQVRAQLGTANASLTPVLISLSLQTQHHLSVGSVESQLYPALGDFLSWATFNATTVVPSLTSVAFFVGNGSDWTQVTPGASLSFIQGSAFQWRAVLTSSDLLVTPSIRNVRVTYEYTGKPVRIQVLHEGEPIGAGEIVNVTLGEYADFSATVYDAGSHVLPSVIAPLIWQSNDSKGSMGQNGSYLPGALGLHWVNVTVSGYPVFASIRVSVTGAVVLPSGAGLWDLWPVYLVAIAAAAGFAVYEVVIRRMFAIDDVFLIAKDGRLILHNTRRMRADRDEDILSGMLTAIMAFLRDQDPEENGELRSFEVGGKTTLLERGRHVYLSAIYSGRVPRWAGKDLHRFMGDLEQRFGDAFAHWSGSPEDLHGLKEYMGRYVSHVRYRPDRSADETAN